MPPRSLALIIALALVSRTPIRAKSSSEESLFYPIELTFSDESSEETNNNRHSTLNRKKDVHKLATVSIQSYTNFMMTGKPMPYWLSTTKKPNQVAITPKKKKIVTTTKKKVVKTKRPVKILTAKPKPVRTTRRTKEIVKCPTKSDEGWFSSLFANHKTKKQTWKSNFLESIYNLFGWNEDDTPEETLSNPPGYSGWFAGFFGESDESKATSTSTTTTTTSTTTTTKPSTTSTMKSWLDSWWDEEDDDGAYAVNRTKSPKKAAKKSYTGYQLIRAHLDVTWKVHEMLDLQEETHGSGVKWWTEPSMNGTCDMLVPPDMLGDMKQHLNIMGVEYDVVIWDLQKAIAYENPRLSKKQRLELEQTRGHPMTWRRYHRYEDILRYLEYLQLQKSDMVDLVPLGRSSEGLPLVAVKLTNPNDDTPVPKNETTTQKWRLKSRLKPSIWIEAGVHAQEWITSAVATWIIHVIVEGDKGKGPDYEMLRLADWYIVPVMNPDGYEFSHTSDRLWHKTRSRRKEEDTYYNSWFPWNWGKGDCIGVDLDRNWNYHWGEKGASKDRCSERYAGPKPFSEPESKAVSKFLLDNKESIKVFLSLHAYSQLWLVPTTHSRVGFSDEGELVEMGKLAAAALADLHGTRYKVGTVSQLLQPATGSSHDWAKGRAGIKYSYSVKLRDASGPYGYLLPGSQIVPTAQEFYEACKAIVDNL